MRNLLIPFLLVVLGLSLTQCKKKDDNLNDTFTSSCDGCGNFRLFKFNSDKSVGLGISGNRSLLGLSTSSQSFDIANQSRDQLWVVVREYHNAPGIFSCFTLNDLDANTALQWEAVSGTADLQIVQDSITVNGGNVTYSVSCVLNDVTFRLDGNDNEVSLDELIFSEVTVGN